MKVRPDMTQENKSALIAAFERAVHTIPSVRNVRIGNRVIFGAGYEAHQPDVADYLVAIDFDDQPGLEAYLDHPAHRELGTRFNESLSAALIYDFDAGGLERLRRIVE